MRNQNRPGDCAHGRSGPCTICRDLSEGIVPIKGLPWGPDQPLIVDPFRWPLLAQLRFRNEGKAAR